MCGILGVVTSEVTDDRNEMIIWRMISGDGQGLSFPDIRLTVEDKRWENLNQENWTD